MYRYVAPRIAGAEHGQEADLQQLDSEYSSAELDNASLKGLNRRRT